MHSHFGYRVAHSRHPPSSQNNGGRWQKTLPLQLAVLTSLASGRRRPSCPGGRPSCPTGSPPKKQPSFPARRLTCTPPGLPGKTLLLPDQRKRTRRDASNRLAFFDLRSRVPPVWLANASWHRASPIIYPTNEFYGKINRGHQALRSALGFGHGSESCQVRLTLWCQAK